MTDATVPPATGRPELPDALPEVTVIVPARDEATCIGRCLDALLEQTYPREKTEIVVVDNGSTDATARVVGRYPVTLLSEPDVRSPYAARNRGIERARGHVLAFTDADCVPDKTWLQHAVDALWRDDADLVGGCVRFRTSPRPRAAELLDSINNLDNARSIAQRGVAKTGNLCAKRSVFTEIGPFLGDRRSGGDVEWTARASAAGFALHYVPDAVVEKPARRLLALARKQYRVGRGQYRLWLGAGQRPASILWRTLRGFRPGRPSAVRDALRRRGPDGSEGRAVAVWWVGWTCAVITGLGRFHELAVDVARGGRR